MLSRFFLVVFSIAPLLCHTLDQDISLPIHIVTSSRHYGPDGPWQAVSVSYGNPRQAIDLYPGSAFESIIFADFICTNATLLPCGSGGLFDPNDTLSSNYYYTEYAHNKGFAIDWTLGALRLSGVALLALDNLTLYAQESIVVPYLSTRLIYAAFIIYPDGTHYRPQVGQLALGSPTVYQSFNLGPDKSFINGSLVPGYLWANKVIPSSSYGLHIGSAALELPLSLWIGGYDQSRILGFIESYDVEDNLFAIDLLDIGIGVNHGGSPFSYSTRKNILAENNSSMLNALSIVMNPAAPYLALPKSTCMAIAKDLPVTFNAKYELYFWNVDDPQYARIVTSPTYLSFTFRASDSSKMNLTIKVPFRLLNLTLEAPLIRKPTPYFPCQPPQLSSQYSLGRAFLQAAFIGVNWNQGSGKWFLAQAPGPNPGLTSSAALYPFSNFSSSSSIWSDTWNGHWTPLPETTDTSAPKSTSTQNTETSNTTRAKMTTGTLTGEAKVGMGIGSAALVLFSISIFFFLRRRRARKVTAPVSAWPQTELRNEPTQIIPEAPGQEPSEIYTTGGITHELHENYICEKD